MGARAVFPPGEAREDWAIIRALSELAGSSIGFDTLDAVRSALIEAVPHMAEFDTPASEKWAKFGRAGKLSDQPLTSALSSYHLSCAISRSSETMAACHLAGQSDVQNAAE